MPSLRWHFFVSFNENNFKKKTFGRLKSELHNFGVHNCGLL